MKFVSIIPKADGTNFSDQAELENQLKLETKGQFGFNPSNHCWHGGLHITEKNAPWVKHKHPVRAIADGEVVAFRMGSEYQTSTFKNETLSYSNGFCLLKHQIKDENSNSFTFYSLYMHLKPRSLGEPPRYQLTDDRNVRFSPPPYDGQTRTLPLKKEAILERTTSAIVSGNLSVNSYKFAEFTVVDKGQHNASTDIADGTKVWIAIEKSAENDLFKKYLKETPSPQWVYDKTEAKLKTAISGRKDPHATQRGDSGCLLAGERQYQIPAGSRIRFHMHKDNALQDINNRARQMAKCELLDETPTKTAWVCVEAENITITNQELADLDSLITPTSKVRIKAGDPISYLGQFDAAQIDSDDGVKETRHQIHFELFSLTKPPLFFLKKFFGDEAAAQLQFLENNEGDEEYFDIDSPSDFFKLLSNLISPTDDEEQVSGLDMRNNLTPWDSAKQIVAKHNSEWYGKAEERSFLNKLIDRFIHPDFPALIEHEKTRMDNLVWIQDAPSLNLSKEIWNWWPVSFFNINSLLDLNVHVKCTRYNGVFGPVVWGDLKLADAGDYWDAIITTNAASNREKRIITGMSPNEGKIDSVHSYDSEVITAGAMQKTLKTTGKGELTTQIIAFREEQPDLYEQLFESRGWKLEDEKLYYQCSTFHNGEKLSGDRLKQALRESCSEANFGMTVECKPIKHMACAIKNSYFVQKQILDFVNRLRKVEALIIPHYNITVRDLLKSNLGVATALDQHINRPSHVTVDIKSALDLFFTQNPEVSTNIQSWTEAEH